ncbi:hypothetical protein QOT17_003434 [Balamuthia mandrillaris]
MDNLEFMNQPRHSIYPKMSCTDYGFAYTAAGSSVGAIGGAALGAYKAAKLKGHPELSFTGLLLGNSIRYGLYLGALSGMVSYFHCSLDQYRGVTDLWNALGAGVAAGSLASLPINRSLMGSLRTGLFMGLFWTAMNYSQMTPMHSKEMRKKIETVAHK